MDEIKIDREAALVLAILSARRTDAEARRSTINVLTRSRHAPSLPGFAAALTTLVVSLVACQPMSSAPEATPSLAALQVRVDLPSTTPPESGDRASELGVDADGGIPRDERCSPESPP